MYYHVYADLCMLSKSNDLGLSVISVSQHYLELQTFLSEVERDPDIVMDPNYQVLPSEERLYGTNKKVNHRLQSQNVYQNLFEKSDADSSNLNSLLAAGASKMKEKLSTYAQDQLPDGRYWDPDPAIKDVLCQLNQVMMFVNPFLDSMTT